MSAPSPAASAATRLDFIDALKALASQAILLHHLAFYGPMSDFAGDLAPALMEWLSQDARIAVQVFLVIGGFLAARSLAPEGRLMVDAPLRSLQKRYLKLALPYLAALLFAVVCSAVARAWMTHDSIPDAPKLGQAVAHAFLLQGLLGFDSLSAGVWYVAIDFQLFALLLGLLWLARHLANSDTRGGEGADYAPALGLLLVGSLAAASLFHFNRDSDWDNWALYFFGAYGLGAMSWWFSQRDDAHRWLIVVTAAVATALVLDYRSRIAVALLTALALCTARRLKKLESWPQSRLLAYLGRISYSVFLLNFPVALVVNAAFSRWGGETPEIHALGMLVAWLATLYAATLFHRHVECKGQQWLTRGWRALAYTGEQLFIAARRPLRR